MNFKNRDLFLALTSAFLGSVKGLLVSQVKNLGAIEIFCLRSIGAVCFMLPIIIYQNLQLWYDFKCNIVLLFRSMVGNIAVTGYYYGFVNLPLAEASLLFYSSPVFTIVLGHFFLKEKCGLQQSFSTVLSLIGVFMVCLPHFSFESSKYNSNVITGITGCITGAFAQAVALVIIRTITHVQPVVVSFWWAIVGMIFSGIFCVFTHPSIWTCGLEAWIIVLIALMGFICELCLVAALKSTDAIIVSIALTFEIMWAFLFQIYINKESVDPITIFGAVAIVISVLLPPILGYLCNRSGQLNLE